MFNFELFELQSEEIGELAAALLKARAKFTPIQKNAKANVPTKGGGKYSYSYSTLDNLIDSVDDALAEHGILITQTTIPGYLVTQATHSESGQWIRGAFQLAVPTEGDPQKLGSAVTYARRYALSALLNIAADDDDDAQAASKKSGGGKGKATEATVEEVFKVDDRGLNDEQLEKFINEVKRTGITKVAKFAKEVIDRKFGQLSELTPAEGRVVISEARKRQNVPKKEGSDETGN